MYLTWDEYNLNEMKLIESVKEFDNQKLQIGKIYNNLEVYFEAGEDFVRNKSYAKSIIIFDEKLSFSAHYNLNKFANKIGSKLKNFINPDEEVYILHAKIKFPIICVKNDILNDPEKMSELKSKYKNLIFTESTGRYAFLQITPKELESFEIVDKLSNYDISKIHGSNELTDKALDYAIKYGTKFDAKKFDKDEINRLFFLQNNIRPNHNIILFRGIKVDTKEGTKNPAFKNLFKNQEPNTGDEITINTQRLWSWSYNEAIATSFAKSESNFENMLGVVLEGKFEPKDIMLDLTLLDKKQLTKIYHTPQREVIIMPGKYKFKVIFKVKGKN